MKQEEIEKLQEQAEFEGELEKDKNLEIELEINKLSCQFCRKHEGVIPITDGETLQEVWICEVCDYDLNWKQEKPLLQKDK